MRGRSYADVIRRVARWSDEDAPTQPPADEQRLIAAVEGALRARARRRALARRVSVVGFAAAAAIALAVGGRAWRGAGAQAVADGVAVERDPRALNVLGADDAGGVAFIQGARVPLRAGMTIGAGTTMRAPTTGEVRFGTTDGTSLALEAGGELRVAEAGATQRLALVSGAVVAHVSRQFSGQRFVVDTRDAEVEVRGTMFRVAVVSADAGCGGGSTTRVSVLEGAVEVRAGGRATRVTAGSAWPEGCDGRLARVEPAARPHVHSAHVHGGNLRPAAPSAGADPPPTVTSRADVTSVAPPAPAEATPVPVARAEATPAPSSSLAAENDLFASAVRAKKQGRLDEAARLFAALATSHPGSPLVESAVVQRMKILASIDPAAGARAAADYLARFPSGFARPEAQALVARSSP
jgi:hypothetical protein